MFELEGVAQVCIYMFGFANYLGRIHFYNYLLGSLGPLFFMESRRSHNLWVVVSKTLRFDLAYFTRRVSGCQDQYLSNVST